MPSGRLLACLLLVLFTAALGCKRDLGECNLDGLTDDEPPREIPGPAAFDIAYRLTDGLPMYEGQALVQSTCGDGTFCHAPAAVGEARIGVPGGLNFDVALACADGDPTCTSPIQSCEGGQTDTPYCERLQRLHGNQAKIREWAEGMIQEMRAGAMPPGEAGRRVENPTPWLRETDDSALPSVYSDEGKEIVRNWLACQAPAVARTETATNESDQLEPCVSVDEEICIYRGPQGELPDPVWTEIYWSIMFTQCVTCHGPPGCDDCDENPNNPLGGTIRGGTDPTALEALDLTGPDTTDTSNWAMDSYPAVVEASAYTGGVCAGFGVLVVPNDPGNSLLLDKMRNNPPDCGTVMPQGGSLAAPLVQVVEDWIDMGAPLEASSN